MQITDKKFKRVIPDPPIDTILPLKGAHRQVALEWIIRTIGKTITPYMDNINLSLEERRKVDKQVDIIVKQLQRKVDKIKGNGL